MASEIRVNQIQNRSGLTTTTFTDTGVTIAGILTVSENLNVGGVVTYEDVTNVDAIGIVTARAGVNLVGNDLNVGSNIKIGNASGIVTATTFSGSGASLTNLPAGNLTGTVADARISSLTASKLSGALPAISGANLTNLDASDLASGTVPTARLGSGTANNTTFLRGDSTFAAVTSTTINGNVDDYIITGSGTANTLNGESSLLYTGSRMGINASSGSITDVPATSHDTVVIGNSSMTSGGICLEGSSSSGNLGFQMYKQGSFLAARMLYEYSTNELQFHSATGGTPGSGEARRMRLQPTGNIVIDDGDLVIGTSGHGIDFGATANGGTGTPNEIFDDYEEGSWTPAIEGLSNTPSYHNLGGNYTKIGNRVFLQCHIQIAGTKPQFSNQSAAFKISGLPFTGSGIAGGGYFGAHGVCVWQQLQWVGGSYSSYGHNDDTQLSPGIVDGGTRITLQTCGQGIYYVGQMLNRAVHNNYSWNIEFDMSYRTAT